MILEIADIIKRIIFMTPQLIIIAVSFQYLRKTKCLDAKLLFAGSSLSLIIGFIFTIIYSRVYSDINFEETDFAKIENLALIQNILISITSILFFIGFFIMIKKYLKKSITNNL